MPDRDSKSPLRRRFFTRRRVIGFLMVILLLVLVVRFWPAPRDADPSRPQQASRTPFEEHDIEVDGLRIRYIDEGSKDDPALVLIPGHTSRIEEYDRLVPRLSESHRVLVLDFPGSGYSEKPVREYTAEFYCDILVGFLDALGVERAHLVGGSLGGKVALLTAHLYPERVDRLAVWAPGSAFPARPWLGDGARVVGCYGLFWPTVKIQSTYWYRPDWPEREAKLDDTFTYYDEVMGPGFIAMYWGLAADYLESSLFDFVAEVPHPALLCWGSADTSPNVREGMAKLHELMPHSELHEFEGAPHALASEIPEQLVELVAEFLDRSPEATP